MKNESLKIDKARQKLQRSLEDMRAEHELKEQKKIFMAE